jgi:type IV pilus assembly protein PilO
MAVSLRDRKTQILIVVVLLAILIVYLFYSQIYKPNVIKIEALQARKSKIEAELQQAREAVSRLPEIQRQYVILMRKWEQAQQLLPSAKELSTLLKNIQNVGYEAGVRFNTFKPSTAAGDSLYSQIPVSMTVTGNYHQLAWFLANIGNLPRIVTSSNVKVIPNSDAKERSRDLTIKADLTTTTYIYIGQAPTGQIDISTWQISPPITEAETRLERETYSYNPMNRRDPFVPLVTKEGYMATAGALNTEDLALIGTMWGSSGRVALVKDSGEKGYVLKPGDRVAGGKVLEVKEDAVIFEINAYGTISRMTLRLVQQSPKYTGPLGGIPGTSAPSWTPPPTYSPPPAGGGTESGGVN